MNRSLVLSLLLAAQTLFAQASLQNMADFSQAIIMTSGLESAVSQKTVQVLQEEIAKRTSIQLEVSTTWSESQPIIFLALSDGMGDWQERWIGSLQTLREPGPEGFRVRVLDGETQPVALVIGQDERGLLYGVGRLLRKSVLLPDRILLPKTLAVSTTPHYPIRGHQLGYRPKTNSYDAWTVQQFDQYIRELALFGANSIEIMPPRTDDDFTSEHMKLPAQQMIAEQSRICDSYGLDVWMWYPNMGENYTHPDSIHKELQERHRVFEALKRLDALFVPGGDPGDLHPDPLFAWLEQVATVLQTYHPQAKIWVSPQAFRPTASWLDAFYKHVNARYSWFGGVVFGPWVKTPIQEMREIVHPDIPIRRYPDITHSLSSQYPIPRWDLAYAMTLGRECINPRPEQEKQIHNALDEYGDGSLSYSEGTNDDVNKFVWSDQDWDPDTPVIETLRDYARLFIHPEFSEGLAHGFLGLETNIEGPLLINENVERTLQQWQALEQTVPDQVQSNYRFQMGLVRAYYDASVRRRLIHEAELQEQAMNWLRQAESIGTIPALEKARATLLSARTSAVAQDLRQRCMALADSLYRSVGAQLTVDKHGAMAGRGNFIDNIDIPLNDAIFLISQMQSIEKLVSESERLQAIHALLHRTDPGPGGFYDNFGHPNSWHRVQSERSWQEDPGNLYSPRVSFGVGLRGQEWVHEIKAKGFEGKATPLAWAHQVTTLYDVPLVITYDQLDPDSDYVLRVAYTGRFRSRMKLVADDQWLIHDFIRTGEQPIYEFVLPREATHDGVVNLIWTCGEGERGSQVAEVWVMRK